MDKVIDFSKSIYEICSSYPEMIVIFKKFGLGSIDDPAVLNSIGRFMTPAMGAAMKGIDIEIIKKELNSKGYIIK
jgi:hypothetical protein